MSGVAGVEAAASADAYRCSLTEYPWGSNMSVANNAMYLAMFDSIKNSTDGDAVARAQLDYLLGVNGTSYCFLSGFGTQSPKSPHHRHDRRRP